MLLLVVHATNTTIPDEELVFYGPEDEPLMADPLVADHDGVYRPKPH